jgi:hypothetical protein
MICERLVLPSDWLEFRATREVFSGLTHAVLPGQCFYIVLLMVPIVIYTVVAKIILRQE